MAIPKINEQSIIDALKYIDENGVPSSNQSTKYELVTEEGKKYPPKYVIAVANHLANGVDISTDGFNAVEAKSYLHGQGYNIEIKQVKYELTITADSIVSTDERFTLNDLGLGDNYKALYACFKKANGEIIERNYRKGEWKNTNQTLPRIAFQVFERQLLALSEEEKDDFPICRYSLNGDYIRGIYSSEDEYRRKRNSKSIEYMAYYYGNDKRFVIYCWNVFSTLIFVQECLKRFGDTGDQFTLKYREKDDKDAEQSENEGARNEAPYNTGNEFLNPFSDILLESRNIIFHGAPGTGKTYLAREIAADIISNGYTASYEELSNEQKQQMEFVQFHPSYDYTDFVEGLRPRLNEDGSMGFQLQDGIFKKFINRARMNYENSQKPKETFEKEQSVQESMMEFFSNVALGEDTFETITGNKFTITSVDDQHIYVFIPGNVSVNKLCLSIDEIRKMLESDKKFEKVKDITSFFNKTFGSQSYSYEFALYKAIKAKEGSLAKPTVQQEPPKRYIFIIDEINRGEISKIFGELFFSIDPGYRGPKGSISTQYANMHSSSDVKFYIPENVFIIGTMNDIDRSVDSFDFAMRRRFRFIELKAADTQMEILTENFGDGALKTDAMGRMDRLNEKIAEVEGLNENYQIGASYFLKLKTLSPEKLWTDYLRPLLQEYVQGMNNEEKLMKDFAKAYGYSRPAEGGTDETAENQG